MDKKLSNIIEYVKNACKDDFIFHSWSIGDFIGISASPRNNPQRLNSINHIEINKDEAIEKIIEKLLLRKIDTDKNNYNYQFSNVNDDFFNKIWLQCQSDSERKQYMKIFDSYLKASLFDIDFIEKMKKYDFFHDVLKYNMVNGSARERGEHLKKILTYIALDEKNVQVIGVETLLVACSSSTTKTMNNLPLLHELKNIVKTHFPTEIDEFKSFWKKITQEDDSIYQFGSCIYLDINKAKIFNLFKNKNEYFHQGRYKTVVNFLNKNKIKKQLGYERILLDGVNETQKEYRLIFFNISDEKRLKKVMQEFLDQVIYREDNLEAEKLTGILNYVLMNDKVPENNKHIKSNKI